MASYDAASSDCEALDRGSLPSQMMPWVREYFTSMRCGLTDIARHFM